LISFAGLETEIRGFTITTALIGDPANGSIDSGSVGLRISNSSVLVDDNYFIDSNSGIAISTQGVNAPTSRIYDNVFAGNNVGITIIDQNSSTTFGPGDLIHIGNDTFAFNKIGILATVTTSSPLMAEISNSIFWENHDTTVARAGAGIVGAVAN